MKPFLESIQAKEGRLSVNDLIMEFAGKLREECRRGHFYHLASTLFYLDMQCLCHIAENIGEPAETSTGFRSRCPQ